MDEIKPIYADNPYFMSAVDLIDIEHIIHQARKYIGDNIPTLARRDLFRANEKIMRVLSEITDIEIRRKTKYVPDNPD